MDVPEDKAMWEGSYGIAEDVPADRLNDILNKLRTVWFDVFSFIGGTDTFIGDGFSAEFVFPDLGLHIGEKLTWRKLDKEHSAFIHEFDPAHFGLDALGDGCFYGTVYILPEICDNHRKETNHN